MSLLTVEINEVTQKRIVNHALRDLMSNAINQRNILDLNPVAYTELAQETLRDELEARDIMNYLIKKRRTDVVDSADVVMCSTTDRNQKNVIVELLKHYGTHQITDGLYLFSESAEPKVSRQAPALKDDGVDYGLSRRTLLVTSDGSVLRYTNAGGRNQSQNSYIMAVINTGENGDDNYHYGHIHTSSEFVKHIVMWLMSTKQTNLLNELIVGGLISERVKEWMVFFNALRMFSESFSPATSPNVKMNSITYGPTRPHTRYFIDCNDDKLVYNHGSKQLLLGGEERITLILNIIELLEESLKKTFGEVTDHPSLLNDEHALIGKIMQTGYTEFPIYNFSIGGYPYTALLTIGRSIAIIPTDCVVDHANLTGYDGYDNDF